LVHEVNQRLRNSVYHQIGTLMHHLHQAMMVCDNIERLTFDLLDRTSSVIGVAAKYVAIADEAFNTCKTMAYAFMVGFSMKGHYYSRYSVFATIRDVGNKFQTYFTTLNAKVMEDASLAPGWTSRVYTGYMQKVKNWRNMMTVMEKHFQYNRPYPARDSPLGEKVLKWPWGWACRTCGANPNWYGCSERGRLHHEHANVVTLSSCVNKGGIWIYDPDINNKKYVAPHRNDDMWSYTSGRRRYTSGGSYYGER